MAEDGFAVFLGGITGVVVPAVMGILPVEVEHIVVAIGLGQDAGRRDAEVLAVSFHDGVCRDISVGLEAVAIHYNMVGAHAEGVECPVHGHDAGI